MAELNPREARGRRVVWAAGLGASLAFLDGTLVHVALPAIRRDLGADLSALQWVVDGYLLALCALILVGGALGDRFGRRRAFGLGCGGFALASLLCGLAPTSEALVAARVIQGVMAAILVPGSLALLSASFEGEARGDAIGAWSAISALTTAAGPLVGGVIVDWASWRWVFLVNLPFALLALAALRAAPETVGDPHKPVDGIGASLVGIGLGGISFSLIEGPERGMASPTVVAAGVAGLLALGLFASWEQRARHPMLPPRLLVNRSFLGANAVTALVYFGLGGTTFLSMLLLQMELGYTASEAGLALLPLTIALAVLARPIGRFAGRHGPRLPLYLGPPVAAAGVALLAISPAQGGLRGLVPGAMLLVGLGMAGVVAPLTTWVFGCVREGEAGIASGINNAVARVAGLMAVAVLPLLGALVRLGPSTWGEGSLHAGIRPGLLFAALALALGAPVASISLGNRKKDR